jgi:oligopeptidase A
MEEISQLSAKFSENLLDATNAFAESSPTRPRWPACPTTPSGRGDRRGESRRRRLEIHAARPVLRPVMQYADNRELRARMYRAYATRAAEFHDGTSKPEWDNTPVIQRMLELRQEDAQMLGYNNFAEVSLAPKMADTPAQVLPSCANWRPRPSPSRRGHRRTAGLRQGRTRLADFQPWDAAYVSEKLLQALRLSRNRK